MAGVIGDAKCGDITEPIPGNDGDVLNKWIQVQKWLDNLFTFRLWAHVNSVENNHRLNCTVRLKVKEKDCL